MRVIQDYDQYSRPRVTQQELDIGVLLYEGLNNREIGDSLHLSELTVRNYISRMLGKFEARNRTHLLAKVVALRRHNHRTIHL